MRCPTAGNVVAFGFEPPSANPFKVACNRRVAPHAKADFAPLLEAKMGQHSPAANRAVCHRERRLAVETIVHLCARDRYGMPGLGGYANLNESA
jgi:hypothetical protein